MFPWIEQHAVQLIFLTGYLCLLAYHGWRGQQRSRALADYLVAGRTLGGIVIALSFYATFVSSVTFVGHAGRSYTWGPAWWVVCTLVFGGFAFVAWFLVAPPLVAAAHRHAALTIPDLLGARYGSLLLRRLAGLVVVVASVFYMVAVYFGATRVLESLLGLEDVELFGIRHAPVVIAIWLIVTAYTLAGGFHSVVATDVIQGIILITAGILLPISLILHAGGIVPLLSAVRHVQPTALDWQREVPLATMLGLALGVGFKTLVEPRLLSRFYGLSSTVQVRRGRWLAPILLVGTYLCLVPVGFLAHPFVEPAALDAGDGRIDTDRLVPYLLGPANVLGTVGGAFFLTGLIAAVMSSIDSVLLVAASSVDHDLIAPNRRDKRIAMRLTRMWVVVLSILAAGLSLGLESGIIEMSAFSGSIYAGCFVPALIVGLFWRRGTRSGALASVAVGLVVPSVWFWAKHAIAPNVHELYLGLIAALVTYVVVSLLTRPESDLPPAVSSASDHGR